MKKDKLQSVNKIGKLFDVTQVAENIFTVKINESIYELVGARDAKSFESYLRKSFRHFYSLDKSLTVCYDKNKLKINRPMKWANRHK